MTKIEFLQQLYNLLGVLPADERDVAWMRKMLATCAPRFSVRKLGDPVAEEESDVSEASALTIDWSAL